MTVDVERFPFALKHAVSMYTRRVSNGGTLKEKVAPNVVSAVASRGTGPIAERGAGKKIPREKRIREKIPSLKDVRKTNKSCRMSGRAGKSRKTDMIPRGYEGCM